MLELLREALRGIPENGDARACVSQVLRALEAEGCTEAVELEWLRARLRRVSQALEAEGQGLEP